MEGFLWKKGGSGSSHSYLKRALGRRNWLRRWFVLEGSYLSYYESFDPEEDAVVGVAMGAINLGDGSLSVCEPEHENLFVLHKADGSNVYLKAETKTKMSAWIRAMQAGMDDKGRKRPQFDSDEHYEILALRRDELSERKLKLAYRQACLVHHPDKGGDAEVWEKVSAAHGVLAAVLEARDQSVRFATVHIQCLVVKGPPGVGMSIVIGADERDGRKVKINDLKPDLKASQFKILLPKDGSIARPQVEDEEVGLKKQDHLVCIGSDDVSRWGIPRIAARLDAFRVPVGKAVLLTFARKVLKDAYFDSAPKRPSVRSSIRSNIQSTMRHRASVSSKKQGTFRQRPSVSWKDTAAVPDDDASTTSSQEQRDRSWPAAPSDDDAPSSKKKKPPPPPPKKHQAPKRAAPPHPRQVFARGQEKPPPWVVVEEKQVEEQEKGDSMEAALDKARAALNGTLKRQPEEPPKEEPPKEESKPRAALNGTLNGAAMRQEPPIEESKPPPWFSEHVENSDEDSDDPPLEIPMWLRGNRRISEVQHPKEQEQDAAALPPPLPERARMPARRPPTPKKPEVFSSAPETDAGVAASANTGDAAKRRSTFQRQQDPPAPLDRRSTFQRQQQQRDDPAPASSIAKLCSELASTRVELEKCRASLQEREDAHLETLAQLDADLQAEHVQQEKEQEEANAELDDTKAHLAAARQEATEHQALAKAHLASAHRELADANEARLAADAKLREILEQNLTALLLEEEPALSEAQPARSRAERRLRKLAERSLVELEQLDGISPPRKKQQIKKSPSSSSPVKKKITSAQKAAVGAARAADHLGALRRMSDSGDGAAAILARFERRVLAAKTARLSPPRQRSPTKRATPPPADPHYSGNDAAHGRRKKKPPPSSSTRGGERARAVKGLDERTRAHRASIVEDSLAFRPAYEELIQAKIVHAKPDFLRRHI